jgi:hypothetical protein
MTMTIDQLMYLVRELPPMTERELRDQGLDFVYGNLAASTNHKPKRDVFAKLADDMGFTPEEFTVWAAGRKWW